MTPHERLVIAIRHGVLVKGKATMRYAADVVHQSTSVYTQDAFTVVPVEAENEMGAARKVAEIAAARRYEELGCVGYVSPTGDSRFFRAAIGEQMKSSGGIALRGVTISIHVWPVE